MCIYLNVVSMDKEVINMSDPFMFYWCICLLMVNVVCFTEIVPPDNWPATGEVMFESVSLSYDTTLDPVVTDFNLHIRSGEKVLH